MPVWTRLLNRRDENGYAAILVAVFIAALMLPLCAISVDVARWYVEIQRIQNAADAASMAGVTYLPDDFASAQSQAITVAARNGYPNSGDSSVHVSLGSKPTQLRVTVSMTVSNSFARAFGFPTTTLSRSAVADYNGPAPMGSPCNTFGNEPNGANPLRGPEGSQVSIPDGGATCPQPANFWAAIAGPTTPKGNGDQFMTRTCGSGNSGCTGTVNDEFQPQGYFYIVRANAAAVGRTVRVQIYDPSWAAVGDNCDAAPTGTINNNNWNDYANDDAQTRYAKNTNNFCTGDVDNGTTPPIVTSFGLRQPTDTYNPKLATPITGCAKQYPGYKAANVTYNALKKGNGAYNDGLAKVFRHWVTLCSFTVTQAGDYYLQVRTNVPWGGTAQAANGTYAGLDADGAYSGSNAQKVYTQTGDDTSVSGVGNNRFAMRIVDAPAKSMSVAGWQRMGMYMNYGGATAEFNLVRVIPAAATKTLTISFYDVGDATSPGTIKVLPPIDSNITGDVQNCVGVGVTNGALAGCQLNNVYTSTYNGKLQTIKIPIPNTYNCTVAQPGGCWFRVRFNFPTVPSDTTTWTANISGDPVRLIE